MRIYIVDISLTSNKQVLYELSTTFDTVSKRLYFFVTYIYQGNGYINSKANEVVYDKLQLTNTITRRYDGETV